MSDRGEPFEDDQLVDDPVAERAADLQGSLESGTWPPEVMALAEDRERLDGALEGLDEPTLLTLQFASLLPAGCLALPWVEMLVDEEIPGSEDDPNGWRRVWLRLEELGLVVEGSEPSLARMNPPSSSLQRGSMPG